MKRFILYIIILLIPIPTLAFKVKRSGAVDLLAVDKRFFYQHEVSIYAMPSHTRLIYSDASNKSSTGSFNIGAGLDYRFFFHQNIGVSMGLQWLQYTGNYKFEYFEHTIYGEDNTDPEYPNNPYYYTKRYNVTENASLHYLEVPIKVLFITPSWNKVQFRSALGINVGYNIYTEQNLTGSYDAELNYTNQNIVVDESESLLLGRFTDIAIYSPNTILKPHVSILAEIGIGIKVSERCQINLDLYGSYALNNTHSYYEDFISMNKDYKGIATTNLVGDIHPFAHGARIGVSVYLGKAKEEFLPNWKKRKLRGVGNNIDMSAYNTNLAQVSKVKETESTPIEEDKKIEDNILTIPETKEEIVEEKLPETIKEDTIKTDIVEEEIFEENIVKEEIVEKEVVVEDTIPTQETQKIEKTERIEPTIQKTQQTQRRALNSPVLFEKDSYIANYHSQRILQIIAASIQEAPPSKIIIVGYTCDIGDDANNYKLGLKRAQEVQALLKAYGITNIPFEIISKGETNSPLQNIDEEHREKNRRVELIYIY